MRLFGALFVLSIIAAGCSPSPEKLAARRVLFNECMEKADSVKESNFALFNKGDDLITACEGYALRNS